MSGQNAVGFGQAFELASTGVAPFQNRSWRKDRLQGGDDIRLAAVHAERGNLNHKHVLVTIDDQPAEEIAFGVDHPIRGGGRELSFAKCQGSFEAFAKKRLVRIDTFGRKQAYVD